MVETIQQYSRKYINKEEKHTNVKRCRYKPPTGAYPHKNH